MARLLDRLRRGPRTLDEPEEEPLGPRPVPPPGRLRRERRALLRAREERIRDLGGLMLEMYRRDRFREDLLSRQCEEIIGLEVRLREIDGLLAASAELRRAGLASRCECGAPIMWGSHFCANCGRPSGATPVVSCPRCGAALPAEAQFCSSCGQEVDTGAPRDDLAARADAGPDPWET